MAYSEMYEFVCDLVSGCDEGSEELSPAMRERAEKIICGGDTLEKLAKIVAAQIVKIDEELEFSVNYISNEIKCDKYRFQQEKDDDDKVFVCHDISKALGETSDELQKLLTQRNVLQAVLKKLTKKEASDGE